MSIQIYHQPWETLDPTLEPRSFHLAMHDVPFNLSEIERNMLQARPGWDVAWSPVRTIKSDARLLVAGGWAIYKAGDRLIGPIRDMLSGDHSNSLSHLEWLWRQGVLGSDGYEEAIQALRRWTPHMPDFEYKATVVWTKESGPHLRESTYESRHEIIAIAKRLSVSGKSVEAPAWQFLSVSAMKNHFSCPPCGKGERLYWHLLNRYEQGGELRGTIVPCPDPKKCDWCAQKDERRSHPCQTPRAVWDFFLERHAKKSLRLRDKFMGVGSLARACQLRGIHYVGTEINWEYATIAQRWIDGEFWDAPEPEEEIVQLRMEMPK